MQYIQNYVQTATKGRVTNFIHAGTKQWKFRKQPIDNNKSFIFSDDIIDAQIFMTSTLFFKGQWRVPFNKTATHSEPFYDEMRNQIGEVKMMYQTGPFPYARVDSLHAHAVELSYGKVKFLDNVFL